MRNLTARLREIVRQDHGGAASVRELTYVPDTDGLSMSPERAAEALGGTVMHASHGCVVIDRLWDAHEWHGRRAVRQFMIRGDAPLALFDTRWSDSAGWADRIVFFDLETTGLSGGAGTLPFLAGCGWFEGETFRVRQFFLAAPSGERAMLEALGRIFDDASLLVTFNGRTFDVPLVETRWAFHRASAPTEDLPHFDMLPPARRLWARRAEEGDRASCTLSSLEASVLGFHRRGDVPGFEIPARYFHFLRTGDGSAVSGVIDHNRYDIVSLAGLMSHALDLAAEGPDAAGEAHVQLALGRLYERAGDRVRAERAYALASGGGDRDVRLHALTRLAALLARLGRHDEAAVAWRDVLDLARRIGASPALERRAVEALAIHHEHRARDLQAARGYAERLGRTTAGRARQDAAHRQGRIDRKLGALRKDLLP